MIPANTSDPILAWMREYVERFGEAPDILAIEQRAGFRHPGGLGRLLTALRAVAVEHLRGRA